MPLSRQMWLPLAYLLSLPLRIEVSFDPLQKKEDKMKRASRRAIIFFLMSLCFAVQPAHAAISITVTGSWIENIDKNDLVSGAGSDLQGTYTNVSGDVLIDISGTSDSSDTWRVDVNKFDSTWDNDLYAYVRRNC
ncbi:unknown protein [Desulfotalea psychrophila LSv54]|uniref:Uncharacterized protein n=2 Tax=Desulfotalea psychrophila TaxID=84980 RepID=Q6ALT4_DESPS|nr:unknown protein [Desulfotalea psychrophila LSv54]